MVKIILVANIVAALVIRLFHAGKMDIVFSGTSGNSPAVNYRIAGINSQPNVAFAHVRLPEGANYDLRYSPLGFNPRQAGRQLSEFAALHYAEDVNIFGISVGAKTMLDVDDALYRRAASVAICPCVSRDSLKPNLQKLIPIGAGLAEVASILLGVPALLPIIPAEDGCYSVALWADLLLAIASGETRHVVPTVVIWSEQDELLDETYFNDRFASTHRLFVDSMHARIGDPNEAPKYQTALDLIFGEGR